MTIQVTTSATSGKTLFASAQQSTGGVLGDTWDVTLGSWQATVADADVKITLTEGLGRNLQSYTGGVATTLGSYTGEAVVRVHDDNAADVVLGSDIIYLSSGVETTIGTIATATVSAIEVSRDRTWFLRDEGEYTVAPEIIQLTVGTTATLAADFANRINPNTDIASIVSVVVDTVQSGTAPGLSNNALSQDRKQVHFDATAAVAGRYRVKIIATTTDGQTFAGYGWIYVD